MASILKVDEIQATDGTPAGGKFNDDRQCVMAFMLTSGKVGDQNPITGWAEASGQSSRGLGKITRGGSVTESSGTFTLPFAGLWSIELYGSVAGGSNDSTIQYHIKSTLDNSTYNNMALAKGSTTGSGYKDLLYLRALFDCSNTTTHKVRFQQTSFGGHTSEGDTNTLATYCIFTWLGDAD